MRDNTDLSRIERASVNASFQRLFTPSATAGSYKIHPIGMDKGSAPNQWFRGARLHHRYRRGRFIPLLMRSIPRLVFWRRALR